MCRRRHSVWLSGQVSYSEGFRRMFRRSFEGGIRQGFGTAPKVLSVGCFGNTSHSPKGSERLFRGGTFRRGFRRGLPGGFRGGRLWSLDSKWAAEIHRLDWTDRNARDNEGRWI